MHIIIKTLMHPQSYNIQILGNNKVPSIDINIKESAIISSLQMLLPGEYSIMHQDDKSSVSLRMEPNTHKYCCNITHQDFSSDLYLNDETLYQKLPVRLSSPTNLKLLRFMQRQQVTDYDTCKKKVKSMQLAGGIFSNLQAPSQHSNVSQTFLSDNACTISKLTDLFKKQHRISYKHTAKLLSLAALFAATSQPSRQSCLFNVSQLNITNNVDEITKEIYKHPVQKQHVTVLLRGNSKEDRVKRINLAVRVFEKEDPIIESMKNIATSLNSEMQSGMMVITGVYDNQAATIFLDTHSQTSTALNLALHDLMQRD